MIVDFFLGLGGCMLNDELCWTMKSVCGSEVANHGNVT